jgi:hypothetical protein
MSTNYSKKELKKILLDKINHIDKLNISPQQKRLMLDKYYSEYKLAKTNLVNNNLIISNTFVPKNNFNQFVNMFNLMNSEFNKMGSLNNSNTQLSTKSYTKSYSMQSVVNPDGSHTIIESTNNIIDGKSNKKTTSYKIDSKGNKIPNK